MAIPGNGPSQPPDVRTGTRECAGAVGDTDAPRSNDAEPEGPAGPERTPRHATCMQLYKARLRPRDRKQVAPCTRARGRRRDSSEARRLASTPQVATQSSVTFASSRPCLCLSFLLGAGGGWGRGRTCECSQRGHPLPLGRSKAPAWGQARRAPGSRMQSTPGPGRAAKPARAPGLQPLLSTHLPRNPVREAPQDLLSPGTGTECPRRAAGAQEASSSS